MMNVRKCLTRPELGFDLLRIYLGIGLVVRGGLFLSDPSLLLSIIDNQSWFAAYAVTHFVAGSHLAGGMLLAVGCYTRLAAALQIPSLLGAVFLVHLNEGLFSRGQSLELATLVLVALILYALFGAGPLSVDRYLERPQPADVPLTVSAKDLPREPATAAASEPDDWGPAPGVRLEPPINPAQAAFMYRDLKVELSYVAVVLTLLIALLASGNYVWAVMLFVSAFITFGVWRIGRAHFE